MLRYKTHYPLPGQQSMTLPEEEVVTYKQFSDFKQLDLIVKLSSYQLEEAGDYLPILPSKRYAMSGNKKSGDEMQEELTEWMREML